jgi:carbamoyl-phosphate synthase large subunit
LNIQYAIYKDEIYLIEVNPRASRTVPFVSKATGIPLAKVATRVMIKGDLIEALRYYDRYGVVDYDGDILQPKLKGHISVKEAVFPFNKLPGADLLLGPEMKSTGEVMGISETFGESFSKAQIAAGNRLATQGKLFLSLTDFDKPYAAKLAKSYQSLGFSIVATRGTHEVLKAAGVESELVLKISEGRPNIEDMIKNGQIAMAINTSDNKSSKNDAKRIRQQVLRHQIPYFTTISAAMVAADAIEKLKQKELEPKALQDYLQGEG